MNACVVAYTFYDNDTRVKRYAEALVKQGHRVDVISLRRPNQSRTNIEQGVNVYCIQQREINEKGKSSYLWRLMAFLMKSFFVISKRHLRIGYDLVHVHNVPDFEVFAALVPKLTGAKIILDIHDILPEFYASKFSNGRTSVVFRLLQLVEKLSCAFSDHVIVSNDLWRDRLIARSLEASKCTTLLNYPDLEIFKRPDTPRKNSKFIMLYPGTLNWHQGLDIAIRAVSCIAAELPEFQFHIYGEGPTREDLIKLVHLLGLETKVLFHESVSLEQIASVMSTSDLGVVPKRANDFGNEAFSTKILEFMAMGLPVIASATKIDRYYFDDSLIKFFRPEDEQDLANCILLTVRDESMRREYADNGLMFVRQNSWNAKQHIYDEIVYNLTHTDSNQRC
jgi:glycosyltransferase involved in cell wall biosynthesis